MLFLAIGSAHGASMPLIGFLLTVAAAAMWACGNIVSRAVGRHGPMNQLAFVVWASLVPPLPFLVLSWLIEGPAAISTALQNGGPGGLTKTGSGVLLTFALRGWWHVRAA